MGGQNSLSKAAHGREKKKQRKKNFEKKIVLFLLSCLIRFGSFLWMKWC